MEAGGGTKHQLFGNFLAFSESLHYLGPEKPLGARKSPKVAKWVTLMCNQATQNSSAIPPKFPTRSPRSAQNRYLPWPLRPRSEPLAPVLDLLFKMTLLTRDPI